MARTGSIARLTAREGAHNALLALLTQRIHATQEEAGTEVFTIHTDPTDPDAVWIYEVYADPESERAHQATAGYAQALAEMQAMLDGEPLVYPLIPLGGKGI